MNGLHLLILLSAYLAFCAAFLVGLNGWISAQSARVQSALNLSEQQISCTLDSDLRASGLVILRTDSMLSPVECADAQAGRVSWRPEVVRIAP